MALTTEVGEAIQQAVRGQVAAAKVQQLNGQYYTVLPKDYAVQVIEELRPKLERIQANVSLSDTRSFIAYVQKFREDGTLMFAEPQHGTLKAVIDYHTSSPAWREHSAQLILSHTPEWKAWISKNNRDLTQREFAEFLEDRVLSIVEPDGALLVEVAKHLEAKRNVKFASGVSLENNAATFSYVEEIEGRGKGNVTVPTRFTLGLSPWRGTDPYQLKARLRYSVSEQGLTFRFVLDDPEKVLEAAFKDILAHIHEETGFDALIGSD